jgi:hypothetical protein
MLACQVIPAEYYLHISSGITRGTAAARLACTHRQSKQIRKIPQKLSIALSPRTFLFSPPTIIVPCSLYAPRLSFFPGRNSHLLKRQANFLLRIGIIQSCFIATAADAAAPISLKYRVLIFSRRRRSCCRVFCGPTDRQAIRCLGRSRSFPARNSMQRIIQKQGTFQISSSARLKHG